MADDIFSLDDTLPSDSLTDYLKLDPLTPKANPKFLGGALFNARQPDKEGISPFSLTSHYSDKTSSNEAMGDAMFKLSNAPQNFAQRVTTKASNDDSSAKSLFEMAAKSPLASDDMKKFYENLSKNPSNFGHTSVLGTVDHTGQLSADDQAVKKFAIANKWTPQDYVKYMGRTVAGTNTHLDSSGHIIK